MRLSKSAFQRYAVVLAALGALHSFVYIPLVESNVATDSRTYEAAADAIADVSYTTPLFAGFYFETTEPFVPANNVDLTGLRIPRALWEAPERQTFRPPGYPLYLAAFGGGGSEGSRTAALIGQGVLFGLGAWLLALTVRRWWNEQLALAATAVYALDPYSKHYISLVLTEALTATLVLAAAYAFTRAWQQRTLQWWAVAAVFCTALTLVRAVFVLALLLLLLAAVARDRLRAALVVAVVGTVLVGPWLAWTASATGRAVLASYGHGFNLLVAAHGEGRGRSFADVTMEPAFVRDFTSVHDLAPAPAELARDPTAHPRYLAAADARLRGLALDRYETRLRDEPAQVTWEALYRMFFLWNAQQDWHQPGGWLLDLMRLLDAVVLLAAAVGVGFALFERGPARVVAIFLLAYTLVLGLHHVEARFAIPLRGLYLAFAVFAGARVLEAARGPRSAA